MHQDLHQGWLAGVEIVGSPNYNQRPREVEVDLLVIHNISLPPGEFGGGYVADFFRNQLDISLHPYFETIAHLQVSAHFFIARSGKVSQFVSTLERAWHAGASSFDGVDNCNDYSIGVELEGSDEIPYTDAQYAALIKLTRTLQESFPHLTRQRIVGHDQIAPGRKTDPGSAFNWTRYLTAL